MRQASRRVFVVGAFFVPFTEEPMKLHSLAQLHSYRGRQSGAMPFGRESWCLAIAPVLTGIDDRGELVGKYQSEPTFALATHAVSNSTRCASQPGGVAERFKAPVSIETGTRKGTEGSIPSSTTEHRSGALLLNNDRVVQRRRAGQRRQNRPAPPSPHAFPQHAAVGRWLRRCDQCRSS
jgi:hypothetical protein